MRALGLTALAVVLSWLLACAAIEAQQPARQSDLDRLQKLMDDLDMTLQSHMRTDYQNFNSLLQVDKDRIAKMETRISLIEQSVDGMYRVLWAIGGGVLLQLLHLFFQLFRVDITKRAAIQAGDGQERRGGREE